MAQRGVFERPGARKLIDPDVVKRIERASAAGAAAPIPLDDELHRVRSRYYQYFFLRGRRMRSKKHGDVILAWLEDKEA